MTQHSTDTETVYPVDFPKYPFIKRVLYKLGVTYSKPFWRFFSFRYPFSLKVDRKTKTSVNSPRVLIRGGKSVAGGWYIKLGD